MRAPRALDIPTHTCQSESEVGRELAWGGSDICNEVGQGLAVLLSCHCPYARWQPLVSSTKAPESHEIVKRFYSNSYNYSALFVEMKTENKYTKQLITNHVLKAVKRFHNTR